MRRTGAVVLRDDRPGCVSVPMNALTDPDARLVIGHRGCAGLAPENTLEAFQQAIALGAHAVEFDVRLSADGVAVVMHDPTLDRTTDRSGRVDQLTLAQLREADAGARFTTDRGRTHPYRSRNIRIPTLDEALALVTGIPLLIELKTPAASAETLRLLRLHGAESRTVVDSMHAPALAPFRNTPVSRGAGADGVRALLTATLLGRRSDTLPFDALCVPPWYVAIPLPLVRFARATRRARRAMHVWTVNDPDYAKRLWSSGVNGIITDDPGTMLACLHGARLSLSATSD